MDERIRSILAGLVALSGTTGNPRLGADAVNRLGSMLGLDGPQVLAAVEAMAAEGLVDLHWGPELTLTDKGRRRGAGEAAPVGGVVAHAGATVVMGNVGSRATVGTGAGSNHSTVAVASVVDGIPAGILAAALSLLRDGKASLPAEAQAPVEALDRELETTLAAASNADAKDGAASDALLRVEEGLKRSTELLGDVERAGGKLASVGGLLKNAWDSISPHLPTIGS